MILKFHLIYKFNFSETVNKLRVEARNSIANREIYFPIFSKTVHTTLKIFSQHGLRKIGRGYCKKIVFEFFVKIFGLVASVPLIVLECKISRHMNYLTSVKGLEYLDHLIMLFKVKIFVTKLLKCKINLTLISYTLARKLAI